jgi:protein-disulfide isomerase
MANKRDEQRRRREEKQRAAETQAKTRKLLSKVALFGAVPVLLLLVIYTILSQGPTYSAVEIAPNDHVRGDANTPVTIVVWADFQCPACATEYQAMARIWPQIQDRAHLIFRHYPITTAHPNTWDASLYAEAAARQNRFWEMHDYLFTTQAIWSGLPDVRDEFDAYALELNMDLEQLHADIEAESTTAKIRGDQRSGNASGVRATPSVFINGRPVARPTEDRLLELVAEEFAAAGA